MNHKGQLLFYKTAMTISKQAGDASFGGTADGPTPVLAP